MSDFKTKWDLLFEENVEPYLMSDEEIKKDTHYAKIAISLSGRKNPEQSQRMKSFKRTEESNKKRSKTQSGVPKKKGRKAPNKGVPMSKEQKVKLSIAGKGNNNNKEIATKVECPHCGKVGNKMPMKRWHFDKCKHKPE